MEAPEPNFDPLQDLTTAERLELFRRSQVQMPETQISSSQIRGLIATGGDWQTLVPESVVRFIRERGLYR